MILLPYQMEELKVTEFIEKHSLNLKLLLFALFHSKEKQSKIVINFSNRFSKHFDHSIELFKKLGNEMLVKLKQETKEENWKSKIESEKHSFNLIIEYDKEILKIEKFHILVNEKIKDIYNNDKNNMADFKILFLNSFIFPRGSIDLTLNKFAVDILANKSKNFLLDELFNWLIELKYDYDFFNINIREDQPDYKTEKNRRNTQIRISLNYFMSENFFEKENIFLYKKLILKENREKILNKKSKESGDFLKKFALYLEKIFPNLKINEINNENIKIGRNSKLLNDIESYIPNVCFSCCDKYDLSIRTFIKKEKNEYYLEKHHIIPFSVEKEKLDAFNNIVKLCPVCHTLLRKGRGTKSEQIEAIKNILKNSKNSYEFCKNYFQLNNNISKICEKIWEKLK